MDEAARFDDLDTRMMTLRAAHRALDARIEQLAAEGSTNLLEMQRLKRQKLLLKDRIALLERTRLPDIIA
jgi:hypothetical protein